MKNALIILLFACGMLLLVAGCTQEGTTNGNQAENQGTITGNQGTGNEDIENQQPENQTSEETIYQGYTEEEALEDLESQLDGMQDENLDELVEEMDNTQGS